MEGALVTNASPAEPIGAAMNSQADGAELLSPLLRAGRSSKLSSAMPGPGHGVVIGELLAIAEDGAVALVRYEGQADSAARRARTTIDLHAAHIGSQVVLMFERGDPSSPIVLAVVRGKEGWPTANPPAQVQVDVDGRRMIVSASEQLVLRCGEASITLTKAGKVLIEGSYLSSRSTGVNRIKGGSVQLN